MKKKLLTLRAPAIFLLCAALLMTLFAACGESSSESSASASSETSASSSEGTSESASASESADVSSSNKDATIVVGLEADAGSLAPWTAGKWGNTLVFYNIYERLYFANEDGTYTSTMVENIEEVDELTYDITIYDYIYDTDGNNITASDVVFSLVDGAIEIGNSAGAFPEFDHAEVLDTYTFRWVNSTPFAYGSMYTELGNFNVVSQKAYEESPDGMSTDPVGTAGYKVTNYVAGSSITLERTDNYWQTDESLISGYGYSNPAKIECQIVLNSSQMALALQSGTIDFAGELSSIDVSTFEGNDDYRVFSTTSIKPMLLLLNASSGSYCQDLNLRKAILTAVNPDEVVASLGTEAEPLSSINYPGAADYQKEWDDQTAYSYNEDEAKELLAESDYNGETLTIIRQSGENDEATALTVQAELSAIGIDSTIETIESATWRTQLADTDGYDIAIAENYGSNYVTNYWTNIFNYSTGKTPIDDPTLQEKLDQASLTGDSEDLLAFNDYINEMAYAKGLFLPMIETVGTSNILSTFVGQAHSYVIGGFTFS